MHQPQHPHHMMQQQQQQNTPPSAAPSPLKAVTTEEIQKCLDENKNLILAILENQNLGKECQSYQNTLQKNLTYLAAVADAQPPPSTPSQPQVSAAQPAISIQQTGQMQQQQHQQQQQQHQQQQQQYLQHQQQQQQQQQQHQHHQQQQQGVQGSRLPFQLNAHPSQDPHYQLMQFQQQQLHGHINLGPGGANGMHQMMHPGMGAGVGSPLMDMRGTNKQTFDGGSGDLQGKSAQGGGN